MTVANPVARIDRTRKRGVPGPKVRQAIELFIRNPTMTQKEAAELAGTSASHFCRQLQRPHTQAYLAWTYRANRAALAQVALRRLNDLMQSTDERLALEALKHWEQGEGIGAQQQTSQRNPSVTLNVILPQGMDRTPVIDQAQQSNADASEEDE